MIIVYGTENQQHQRITYLKDTFIFWTFTPMSTQGN